jgi:hypothetical protein
MTMSAGDHGMANDWLVDAIDDIDAAVVEVHDSVQRAADLLKQAKADRDDGVPLPTTVDQLLAKGGRDARLRAARAIGAFEHAVMVLRARTLRALVDEEKMTLTDVARMMSISRQMCSRLYRSIDVTSNGAGALAMGAEER